LDNSAGGGGRIVETVLIGVSAALALCVFVLIGVLIHRHRAAGRRTEERVATVVASLNERMDELSGELITAVQRADEEGRRRRVLIDITRSVDLDDVLARTLEAATSATDTDAAVVTVRTHDGKPIVATMGLSAEEAERQGVAVPGDARGARSVVMSFRYPPGEAHAAKLIYGGLGVPIVDEDQTGFLTVFTRSPNRSFDEQAATQLEELAAQAAPAIENARRFREARQLADLDALTGLHNRRYFHETLAREVARAHRYSRRLSLIVIDVDDFKNVNDRIGHLAGDAVLAELAERVRDVVRSADVACRVGGDEFAVILPESGLADADHLYRRIQTAVSARPLGHGDRVVLSAGVTELRPDDDAIAFFQRADEALYRAKELGKGRAVIASAN
jgi:diguanylate cyclase (GGDEF)-like protein